MHTATSLKKEMYEVTVNGQRASREQLFAAHRYERIGVVVTSPLGGLGASFLVQLGITAYYDVPHTGRDGNPHYPELYFFHVGGAFGEYSLLDAWPSRKQIYLKDDGPAALAAINSHAITHLILPDEPERDALHSFIEPNAALDRLERCFLYDPSGRTAQSNVSIRALNKRVSSDIFHTIDLGESMAKLVSSYPVPDDIMERQDNEVWMAQALQRVNDTTEADRLTAKQRRNALEETDSVLETYRQITASEAVRRLGRLRP